MYYTVHVTLNKEQQTRLVLKFFSASYDLRCSARIADRDVVPSWATMCHHFCLMLVFVLNPREDSFVGNATICRQQGTFIHKLFIQQRVCSFCIMQRSNVWIRFFKKAYKSKSCVFTDIGKVCFFKLYKCNHTFSLIYKHQGMWENAMRCLIFITYYSGNRLCMIWNPHITYCVAY